MKKTIAILIYFLLVASSLYAQAMPLNSGEQVAFIQLPEAILGVKVEGRSICSIELIEDAIRYVRPLFEVRTNESLNSLSFQFIELHQESNDVLWSEKWIAKGTSSERQYTVKFKYISGNGTDIAIEEIDSPQKSNNADSNK